MQTRGDPIRRWAIFPPPMMNNPPGGGELSGGGLDWLSSESLSSHMVSTPLPPVSPLHVHPRLRTLRRDRIFA